MSERTGGWAKWALRLCGALAVLAATGCGISREQFLQAADSANTCTTAADCMVLDLNRCVCPVLVNGRNYPNVLDTSEKLWCGANVNCSAILEVDCVSAKCVVTKWGPLPGSENTSPDGG